VKTRAQAENIEQSSMRHILRAATSRFIDRYDSYSGTAQNVRGKPLLALQRFHTPSVDSSLEGCI
jgi:hypothetical protein